MLTMDLAASAAKAEVGAYNEAMGYDSSSPEPCGHHCPSDCPRCGREEN